MFNRIQLLAILVMVCGFSIGCGGSSAAATPTSSTGIQQAQAAVTTGTDGLTNEQRNIKRRIEMENQAGAIKHLYIMSALSGQVLIYSTVEGKVTSSGKRLSPYRIVVGSSGDFKRKGFTVDIGGKSYTTDEVLQDDGTYGSSIRYLFWFDSQGRFHQHYLTGGQICHICDQPLRVPKIIINMETGEIGAPSEDPSGE